MQAFSETSVAENGAHGIVEIRDCKIRRFAQRFFITALDESRAATCGVRAIDIAPAIAYDITPFRIDVQLSNCAEDHAWTRLTAIARLAITLTGMIANLNAIKQWKRRLHFQIHRFNGFATLSAAANVGLVGDDNQEKVRSLKPRTSVRNILVKLELLETRWRIRHSVPNNDPVDYSIAIEKNCASRYFMLSHFVSAILRVGCEIHKCHTTA
jgi:hypothetical protein